MTAKLIEQPLTAIKTFDAFQTLMPKIKDLPEFQAFNKKGNGMYQAALNQYAAYLADGYQSCVDEDVFAVLAQTISLTEKQTLISARIGQGAFRKNLFKHWQGCAVTGYAEPSLLVASHIKPWHACSNVERLDPYNGFLLLPNLDSAFDVGLISFKDTGGNFAFIQAATARAIRHCVHYAYQSKSGSPSVLVLSPMSGLSGVSLAFAVKVLAVRRLLIHALVTTAVASA